MSIKILINDEYVDFKKSFFKKMGCSYYYNNNRLNKYIYFQFNCIRCGNITEKGMFCRKLDFICRKCKTKQTSQLKYGTDSPNQSQEVANRKAESNIKKYGKTSYFSTEKFKEKSMVTKIKRYGDKNFSNREKSKNTILKKYGVENISQSQEIKDKKVKSYIKKYGVENPSQSEEIKEIKKEKSLIRYGTECVLSSTEIKNKIKSTMLLKYNVEYAYQLEQNIYSRMNAHYSSIHKRIYDELSKYSFCEKEVIIDKYSVDIILRDKKIIIECYGDYWHCNPKKYNANYYHKHLKTTARLKWNYDNNRKKYLERLGYIVLIFWENDINTKFDIIINNILLIGQ